MSSGLCTWQRLYGAAIVVVVACLMAACTSSDGVSTAGVGTGGTGTITVVGKVADGYLANATVFLDKNGNYRLDSREPSAVTDETGSYSLPLDPADVGKFPIVAIALAGATVDKDGNTVIPKSYLLSMPKESVTGLANTNFISPVSTQLREMLETGLYATPQHATDVLRGKLGLPPGADVTTDFIVTTNSTLHGIARNVATLMGNQWDLVLGSSYNAPHLPIDINRYRGMMGAVFNNMSSIRKPYDPALMTTLSDSLATTIRKMPPPPPTGEPYRNMSSSYKGESDRND